jgi:lipid A 3-O-deacylase PagL
MCWRLLPFLELRVYGKKLRGSARILTQQTTEFLEFPEFSAKFHEPGDPLQTKRVCQLTLPARQNSKHSQFHNAIQGMFLLAVIASAAPGILHAQQPETALLTDATPPKDALAPIATAEPASASSDSSATSAIPIPMAIDDPPPNPKPHKHTPESEIAVEGMVSYGNWQIFAAGLHEELYTAGFEYDRHSWGHFAGAQMDYAADLFPLVLLREPRVLNPYGIDRSRPGDKVILPGLAFSPIGLRMQWRHNKAFKPYFTVLGGAIGFTQKALSPDASYFDFTLHESIGFYMKMSQRLDMRFGLFGDFHFSNAYITSYNPGLDVMNSSLAVSYHFGG